MIPGGPLFRYPSQRSALGTSFKLGSKTANATTGKNKIRLVATFAVNL